jgi:RNA polymerase sigma factor (sigma-70 family)
MGRHKRPILRCLRWIQRSPTLAPLTAFRSRRGAAEMRPAGRGESALRVLGRCQRSPPCNAGSLAGHDQDVDDRRARFERLWQDYAPAVAAYARRRAEADAAEDAVADTFLIAWRRLERVPDNALPWLYGVARRTLANQRRTQTRRTALVERLDLELPPIATGSTDSRVLEALAMLGERDRELLLLIAWEGLRPAEAAAALGWSAVATRVQLHRARGRFAAALAALEPAHPRAEPNPKEAR